jgi:hypothetical protein
MIRAVTEIRIDEGGQLARFAQWRSQRVGRPVAAVRSGNGRAGIGRDERGHADVPFSSGGGARTRAEL